MRLFYLQQFPLVDFTTLFVQRDVTMHISHEETVVAPASLEVVGFSWDGFVHLSLMCWIEPKLKKFEL
jgi:hypothetical protein